MLSGLNSTRFARFDSLSFVVQLRNLRSHAETFAGHRLRNWIVGALAEQDSHSAYAATL